MTGLTRQLLTAAFLIALGLSAATAVAAPDTAALARQLASHSPECGQFRQIRWLADFEIDIESTGTFRRTEEGIIWRTETPVETEVRLSADNPDLPPGFHLVLPVMTALLGGDWERLNEHFQIDVSGELAAWSAELTPLDSRVAAQLPLLRVAGGQLLENIEMIFADGDRLSLNLSAVECASDTVPQTP